MGSVPAGANAGRRGRLASLLLGTKSADPTRIYRLLSLFPAAHHHELELPASCGRCRAELLPERMLSLSGQSCTTPGLIGWTAPAPGIAVP